MFGIPLKNPPKEPPGRFGPAAIGELAPILAGKPLPMQYGERPPKALLQAMPPGRIVMIRLTLGEGASQDARNAIIARPGSSDPQVMT